MARAMTEQMPPPAIRLSDGDRTSEVLPEMSSAQGAHRG